MAPDAHDSSACIEERGLPPLTMRTERCSAGRSPPASTTKMVSPHLVPIGCVCVNGGLRTNELVQELPAVAARPTAFSIDRLIKDDHKRGHAHRTMHRNHLGNGAALRVERAVEASLFDIGASEVFAPSLAEVESTCRRATLWHSGL